MAPGWLTWWLEWRERKGSARRAAGPSPAAPSDPNVKLLPAGTSPSAPTTGRRTRGAPYHASPGVRAASSPASPSPGDGWGVVAEMARAVLAPPPLDELGDPEMLAVAAVPGKILEEWRHVAVGVWIGWPHAAGAAEAEEMTAAQLRNLLTERDTG